MIGKYGGDALRLYLMGSPVMKGEDIIISEEQYKSQVRGIMLVLWNVYNFFITYANAEEWEKVKKTNQESSNVLDKWLLSLTQRLVKEVTVDLEQFDTISAINRVSDFINKMSTWYIRRSRDRVRNDVEDLNDKEVFFATTFKVLITLAQVLAPLAPFLAESIYRNLTGKDSVHLSDWPVVSQNFINNSLEEEMEMAILLASKTHSFRKEAQIKVRIPFKTLSYTGPQRISDDILQILLDELNVKKLDYAGAGDEYQVSGETDESNLEIEEGKAREIARSIQAERKKRGLTSGASIVVELPDFPKEYEEFIKKRVNAARLSIGNKLEVKIAESS
jgi:isoleucyl-tRNA synthetase